MFFCTKLPIDNHKFLWYNGGAAMNRRGPKPPLYHTLALFVNRQFEQIIYHKIPKISAILPLDFYNKIYYNYIIKRKEKTKCIKQFG